MFGNTGRFQHYNRHVREGRMTKKVANSGRWEFYVVPKPPFKEKFSE